MCIGLVGIRVFTLVFNTPSWSIKIQFPQLSVCTQTTHQVIKINILIFLIGLMIVDMLYIQYSSPQLTITIEPKIYVAN